MMKKILIIGGAGYVGTELTKLLLNENYEVTIYDLFIYGDNFINQKNLKKIVGDIRNLKRLKEIVKNHDAIIHLACISNDPSFDLNPELGRSINFDPFEELIKISKDSQVKRFIYASSSSVYGIKNEKDVSEDMSLEPLTDYSKYKAMCEEILLKNNTKEFTCCILRPATCCGFSDRLRLDLVVNILTNYAFNKKVIKVFGGEQMRPNVNIKDMCNAYLDLLEQDSKKISGQIFNVGYENLPVKEIALKVKKVIGKNTEIITEKTDDNRSYHISSKKIQDMLNFEYKYDLEEAINSLKSAFQENKIKDSFSDAKYFNIVRMKELNLK